jgi:hypothetical protein
MAKCPGLIPIVMLLPLVLGGPAIARAVDQPVATAVIPPPLPAAPPAAAPKATGTQKAIGAIASPAKPSSAAAAESPKRIVRPAALPRVEPAKRVLARKSARYAKRERHLVVARAYTAPHTAPWPRYYYPGAPVAGPDSDGPPPQWYERGRPLAGHPYPYPRGPIPPW